MNLEKLNNFYKNDLIPKLAILESKRKKTLFWAFFISILFAAICYILAIHINIDSKTFGPLIFTALLPYLLITEKYKLSIQKKVMHIFMSYFDNFNYVEDEHIPDYKLAKSKLFTFNTNEAKSSFYGVVNGQKTTITICKLNIIDKKTEKKSINFNGIISYVLTNHYFQSHTIIINNLNTSKFVDLNRVESKTLNIFSSNSSEAEKITTPELSKWFNSIKDVFNSDKYAISFFDNTILIAIYAENLKCFEFNSIYQKIYFSNKMQTMYESLAKLLEVNYLPLPVLSNDETNP